MKAIEVKSAAGEVKHFFNASDNDGKRARHERDNSIEYEQNFDAAALKLCHKQGWTGTLIKGWLGRDRRVYVWLDHDAYVDVTKEPQ